MKSLIGFLKTTIVGGALYLVPIALIVVVLAKVHAVAIKLVTPIAASLELHEIGGINAARLIAVFAVLLLCFLAGLMARTAGAQRLMGWLQRSILSNVPGYQALATLGEQTVHAGGAERTLQPVLARIEDAWQLGLLIERIDDQHVAVYIPGAPDPKSGSVYFMTNDRIRVADVPLREATKCLKALGIGASGLFAGRVDLSEPR